MRREKLIPILLWSIAIVLLAFTLSQLPLQNIYTNIQSLTPINWIIWLLLNSAIILLLTWRWHLLIRAFSASFPFLKLFYIRQAGQTVSFITPGPQFGGEPLQIYWLYKKGILLRTAIFSLGLDRLMELVANFAVLLLAALLLLSLSHSDVLASNIQILFFLLIAITGFLCGGVILFLHRPDWINRQVQRVSSRWQQNKHFQNLGQQWKNIGDDWRALVFERKGFLFTAVLLSLLGWVGLLAELWLVLHFVGVNPDLYGFLLILLALRMALLLPIPGGIGTLEAAVIWSFNNLDLSTQAAISFIALMRLRDVIVLLIGFYCLKLTNQQA
jgi:glycosyltransferase 2 family protein